jgi:hypothetical protein
MMDNFEVELTGREAKNFDRWVVSQWDEGAFQFDDKPGTWELVSAGVGGPHGQEPRCYWTFRQLAWFK